MVSTRGDMHGWRNLAALDLDRLLRLRDQWCGRVRMRSNLGQVVRTRVPLSPSSRPRIWYWSKAWALAGMGNRGHLPPPSLEMLRSVLCISTCRKTFSIRIIYALFSQPVVSFWGLSPHTSSRAASLEPAGWLSSPRPICPPLKKNPAGARGLRRWCRTAGKVTVGMAECNDSLPSGLQY